MSDLQKEAIRQSRIGYNPADDTKRKISEALKGRRRTSFERMMISIGMRKYYQELRNNG
jgi:hypothetical protein